MASKMIAFCVTLVWVGQSMAEDAQVRQRPIDLNEKFRIVGKSGVPLGYPFRAKFAPSGSLLKLVAVNGTELKVPLTLRRCSDFVCDSDHLFDAYSCWSDQSIPDARQGVEFWAWETGRLAAVQPEPSDPDRRALEFRSLIVFERASRSDESTPEGPLLPTDVRVEEISGDTKVKGCLGHELGTWMVIKGKWAHSDELGWSFQILEVNGNEFQYPEATAPGESRTTLDLKPCDISPCRFSHQSRGFPREGVILQMEAYETFGCVPDEVTGVTGLFFHHTVRAQQGRRPGRYTGLRWRSLIVADEKSDESN